MRTQLTVTYNVSRGKSQALSPVFDNQNVYRVGDRQSSAPQLSLLTSWPSQFCQSYIQNFGEESPPLYMSQPNKISKVFSFPPINS